MAKQNSFDIVSEVDMAEVKNALNQASKELNQRYDLKGTGSSIVLDEKQRSLLMRSKDEFYIDVVKGVLIQKLVRRKVPVRAVDFGEVEPAAQGTVKQGATLQEGIPTEKAKQVVKFIKRTKLKAQAAIQENSVRVSSKDRDTLQEIIALVKEEDFGIDMQFTNYR